MTRSLGVETTWVMLEIDRPGSTAAYARVTPGHHAGVVRAGCADAATGHSSVSVVYDMTLLNTDPAEPDAYAEGRFELMMQEWSDAIAAHLDGRPI